MERPILFSGPMVRAILAGAKTQTRRLVTPMQGRQSTWLTRDLIDRSPELCIARTDKGLFGAQAEHPRGGPLGWIRSPYGEPGDRLRVRETWRAEEDARTTVDGIRFRADDAFVPIANTREAADRWVEAYDNGRHGTSWRPSIFLPRWASRLALPVESVRVERLQDITEEDAKAEGVEPFEHVGADQTLAGEDCGRTQASHPYTLAFAALWDSINGERASWASNPWVWVITFSRVQP